MKQKITVMKLNKSVYHFLPHRIHTIKLPRHIFARIGRWFKFFKNFSGLTLRSHLNIIFSAIVDILKVLLFPKFMLWNPRTLWSGLYVVNQQYNFIIFTRGGTEDLYYALPRREPPVYDLMLSILKKMMYL
jgi:hypothetical protein